MPNRYVLRNTRPPESRVNGCHICAASQGKHIRELQSGCNSNESRDSICLEPSGWLAVGGPKWMECDRVGPCMLCPACNRRPLFAAVACALHGSECMCACSRCKLHECSYCLDELLLLPELQMKRSAQLAVCIRTYIDRYDCMAKYQQINALASTIQRMKVFETKSS